MLVPLKVWCQENRVKYPHARRLASTGLLPCVRLGRLLYVDSDQIAQWAHEGGAKLPGVWRRSPIRSTPRVNVDAR